MVRQDSKRSCWTSPKRHHNRLSLMAVVANQAVAFDKSMLMACPHLGDVLRPGLILDHGQPFHNPVREGLPTKHLERPSPPTTLLLEHAGHVEPSVRNSAGLPVCHTVSLP